MLELFGVAVGSMGLNPDYVLDEMDFEDFNAIYAAYDNEAKMEWERSRLVAYYSAAPHIKDFGTIEKAIPFGWEKGKKSPKKKNKYTIEQIREFSKSIK